MKRKKSYDIVMWWHCDDDDQWWWQWSGVEDEDRREHQTHSRWEYEMGKQTHPQHSTAMRKGKRRCFIDFYSRFSFNDFLLLPFFPPDAASLQQLIANFPQQKKKYKKKKDFFAASYLMLLLLPSLGGFSAYIESFLRKRDGKVFQCERRQSESKWNGKRFMYLLEAFLA